MGKHDRNLYTDEALSPMLVSGGAISDGGSGTVTISALTALLREGTGATDRLVSAVLAEQASQPIGTANIRHYVVLKYNSGAPSIAIQTTRGNRTTEIGIGTCMKDSSDNVHFNNAGMRLQNGVAKLHRRAAAVRSTELASGCTITDEGGASRQFNMAAGVVYHGINRLTPFSGGAFDSGTDKFTYIHGDTATGFTYTDDSTVINNTQYWNPTTHALTALTASRYGCHWVYLHPDDEHVYVVMGTTNNKLAEAELTPQPTDTPIEISDFAVLLGCIIIEKDATAFATIQMVTDIFFTGTAVADHGALEGLGDDDHTQYIKHSLATAVSDFLAASGAGVFVKKTLAEVKTILGLPGGYTEGAKVWHSAHQSIPTSTWTTVAFDSEAYDTDSIHDLVTNNSRLTCKTAGKYVIVAYVLFAPSATGYREGEILNDGVRLHFLPIIPVSATVNTAFFLLTIDDLAVNNYLELRVFQDSGGALSCYCGAVYNTHFWMQRVG